MAGYLHQLPLYEASKHENRIQQYCRNNKEGNKGLLFERLFGGYTDDWQVDKLTGGKQGENLHPLAWLKGHCGNPALLQRAQDQRLALISALNGRCLSTELNWHMVTGTGQAHPLGNGFCWHHTLGTPYLPASSIKGMLRAWLTEWDTERFSKSQLIELFGSERNDVVMSGGELQFFDALPLDCPELMLDVMTPHGGDWYQDGASKAGDANTLPADWQSPVPITFLVVKQARFLFSLTARTTQAQALLPEIMQALEQALGMLGIGAKTAVGYGIMQPTTDNKLHGQTLLDKARQQREARLAALQEQKIRALLSPNQLAIADLRKKLQSCGDNKQARESFNTVTEALVNQAVTEGWNSAERLDLIRLVEDDSAWLKVRDSKKCKPRKDKITLLKEC